MIVGLATEHAMITGLLTQGFYTTHIILSTGYVFDLSSLKSTAGYSTTDREGHELKLNVCGWLYKSPPCVNGTG